MCRWGGLLLWGLLLSQSISASNIRIQNTRLANLDTTAGTVRVQFDLSWDNSWRLPPTLAPANWDAAWVFVKFRVGFVNPLFTVLSASSGATTLTVNSTLGLRVGQPLHITAGTGTLGANTLITAIDTATSEITLSVATTGAISNATVEATRIWEAAWLHNDDHSVPAGTTVQIGLPDESAGGGGFDASTNPGVGAFVYRSAPGSGDISLTDLALRWNYRLQGLGDDAIVDVQVFGIEMVYVPEGSFLAGSGGTETNSFTTADNTAGNTIPYLIGAVAPTLQGNNAGSNAANLSARGELDLTGTGTASLAADFPTGYAAFYSMKHEISQQAYVDFLNSLRRNQQNERTETDLSEGITSVTNRFVLSGTSTVTNRNSLRCDATIDGTAPLTFYCDLNANGTSGESADGAFLACNFLSWADVATYLDWAGLRPLTELEFEKAGRGNLSATPDAYAWGTTGITEATGISNGGARDETASNAAAQVNAGNQGGVSGPLRTGVFADGESSRLQAGAGFYGILELSGNVWERTITVGHADGRSFTGLHGDGKTTDAGQADVNNWPDTTATGVGFRGGNWADAITALTISDRSRAATVVSGRENISGGRGGRLLPSSAAIIEGGL